MKSTVEIVFSIHTPQADSKLIFVSATVSVVLVASSLRLRIHSIIYRYCTTLRRSLPVCCFAYLRFESHTFADHDALYSTANDDNGGAIGQHSHHVGSSSVSPQETSVADTRNVFRTAANVFIQNILWQTNWAIAHCMCCSRVRAYL
jgi:hypothetical protein